jgi:three-Cys-motif partner protein
MNSNKNLWDISNRTPTKTKLEILEKVFVVWLTIWNKQDWVSNEWYVIDLFAGRGKYINNGNEANGSPLIFLTTILQKLENLKKNLKIKLFFIEKDRDNFNSLKSNVYRFIEENIEIKNKIEIEYFNNDCNTIIDDILSKIKNEATHPLFVLIDPTGLQAKKATIEKILGLKNHKDIMFNYSLEGVRRTSGVARKVYQQGDLTNREIKTVKTLQEFIGENNNITNKSDIEKLKEYCNIFTSKNLGFVAFDVKYPDRDDTLYYLLFVSKKLPIIDIVKDIYAKHKEKILGLTLFGGKEFYKSEILAVTPELLTIKRKSLLYETKVEYGNWTINHIVGCKHGCRFPCYAMMLAKKFGWIKDYKDWMTPRIAENALELLEKEIPKYKNKIDFVHLCFMSDPFMYDLDNKDLIPEIKELTLKIIEMLNQNGIRVTTLTKGIYPDEIIHKESFIQSNEYGITLVSLSENFKKNFEPFSAPYKLRIDSLKKLAYNGLNTWVSLEPYPTPDLDETAQNIEEILDNISFVKKIIFGKLNYRRLSQYKTINNKNNFSIWKNNDDFYKEIAEKIINFCHKNNIKYHIKIGTPLSSNNTINIFR